MSLNFGFFVQKEKKKNNETANVDPAKSLFNTATLNGSMYMISLEDYYWKMRGCL